MARTLRFFQDNFGLLLVIVLAVWLGVVWGWFRQSERFSAYAIFGTALATLALALATAVMASLTRQQVRQSRELVEQNRQLVEQYRILALRPWATALIAELVTVRNRVKELKIIYSELSFSWYRRTDRKEAVPEVYAVELECTEEFKATFLHLAEIVYEFNKKADAARSDLQKLAEGIARLIPCAVWTSVWQKHLESYPGASSCEGEARVYCVGLMLNKLLMDEDDFKMLPIYSHEEIGRIGANLWPNFGDELTRSVSGHLGLHEKTEAIRSQARAIERILLALEADLMKQEHEYRMEYRVHPGGGG